MRERRGLPAPGRSIQKNRAGRLRGKQSADELVQRLRSSAGRRVGAGLHGDQQRIIAPGHAGHLTHANRANSMLFRGQLWVSIRRANVLESLAAPHEGGKVPGMSQTAAGAPDGVKLNFATDWKYAPPRD